VRADFVVDGFFEGAARWLESRKKRDRAAKEGDLARAPGGGSRRRAGEDGREPGRPLSIPRRQEHAQFHCHAGEERLPLLRLQCERERDRLGDEDPASRRPRSTHASASARSKRCTTRPTQARGCKLGGGPSNACWKQLLRLVLKPRTRSVAFCSAWEANDSRSSDFTLTSTGWPRFSTLIQAAEEPLAPLAETSELMSRMTAR